MKVSFLGKLPLQKKMYITQPGSLKTYLLSCIPNTNRLSIALDRVALWLQLLLFFLFFQLKLSQVNFTSSLRFVSHVEEENFVMELPFPEPQTVSVFFLPILALFLYCGKVGGRVCIITITNFKQSHFRGENIVENARQSHTWQWASGHVRSRSEECM